ncbi:MAG TPA: ABC transporter substrate-binding protein [bacterium]|nr:ABC transporter substrate-binding protein [bacterium]
MGAPFLRLAYVQVDVVAGAAEAVRGEAIWCATRVRASASESRMERFIVSGPRAFGGRIVQEIRRIDLKWARRCGVVREDGGAWTMKRWVSLAVMATLAFAMIAVTPAGAAIELKFYYPIGVSGPLAKVMNGLVDDFNMAHPGVHVTPIFSGDYYQTMTKVQTAVMGGAPPDVAVLLSTDLFTLLDMHAIIPLDGFIQQAGGERFRADFFSAFLRNSQIGNTTYSIPFQRSTIVLYYNQDAFRKAGLDPHAPPKNWTELISDAQKLTIKDASGHVTQWGVGIPTSGNTYWVYQGFVIEAGQARLANPEGTQVFFDTPGTHAALALWLRLAAMGVEPSGITDWGTLPTAFANGQFAMIYHSTGSLTFIRDNAKFSFGTAFMPAGRVSGTPTGGGNLYIFQGIPVDHQRAAWQFVQWMTAPQQAARWSEASGYVAVRQSAFGVASYKAYTDKFPQALTARDQLAYAQAELATHQSGQIQLMYSDHLQAVLTGRQTLDQGLSTAQQEATKILAPFQRR